MTEIPFDPNCKHDGVEWQGTYGCDSCHYCPKCFGSKEKALEAEVARLRAALEEIRAAAENTLEDRIITMAEKALRTTSARPSGE